ncbi:hypothetical protein C8R45DRAFT_197162 [Mycena sanguinolenta]|nr:hypothetical protein C8R45DRAFT_197162 [Mycena sanguinolenta]
MSTPPALETAATTSKGACKASTNKTRRDREKSAQKSPLSLDGEKAPHLPCMRTRIQHYWPPCAASRVHTGERNHKCPFPGCETKCSRQDNLQQHYRIHLSPGSRRKSGRTVLREQPKHTRAQSPGCPVPRRH